MTTKEPKNMAASVRRRLLNLAREKKEEFGALLTRYGLERILYRISVSPYKDQFILKGAMLFALWEEDPTRATRDLDLLGKGENSIPRLEIMFKDICRLSIPMDGLLWRESALRVERIREDQEYMGLRVQMLAVLDSAQIPIQVDVGFGDAVVPPPQTMEYPSLLGFPPAKLKAYSKETVIAEKFQAMVELGISNSRMKDFYDLWVLTHDFDFKGDIVLAAIQATFHRRRMPFPKGLPLALTVEFREDKTKLAQWKAFLLKARVQHSRLSFQTVGEDLSKFFSPLLASLTSRDPFKKHWDQTGGWK